MGLEPAWCPQYHLPTLVLAPRSCSPGLESSHTSLHPGQEPKALTGDAGSEAAVQREQGL